MRKVMIIRHAEKPGGKIRGVAPDGSNNSRGLTPRGWQRAGALVRYFDPASASTPVPGVATPAAIFASRVEKKEKSRRPRQTVKPLATALRIAVDASYGRDTEPVLVQTVLQASGPVLVCWHHENIPALVSLLAPSVSCPQVWPDDRFDLVWILDQDASSAWTLTQRPQLLLAGDSADPIG